MQQRFEIGFFILLLLGALWVAYLILFPYLATLFLALILAIALHPLYHFFHRNFGGGGTLAALVIILLVSVVIIVPLLAFGFLAFRDAQDLYTTILQNNGGDLGKVFTTIEARLREFWPTLQVNALEYAKQALAFTVQNLGGLFLGVANILLHFFLLILSLFFFLRDGEDFKKSVIAVSPLANQYDEKILRRLTEAINAVVRGKLAIALLQGILTGLGFLVFGVPSPMLWGAVATVAALLPPFGTMLVSLPAIVYLFFTAPLAPTIGLLIWSVIIVGLVDNIIGTIVVERKLRMHPLFVLLGVLGGLAFFGPIGFFAGPVALALLFSLFELYPTIINVSSRQA
ncbi:MAG: AI-2E family transporter [Candidatus Liptonbacteria bacterium]|nr:AI-2E family transporter [Candidatus Liptonbacteria bacterium]